MLKRAIFSIFILAVLTGAAFAQSAPQALSLKPGFNFIAFTLKPSLTPAQLKAQFPAIDEIYSFNASSGSFLSVSEGTLISLGAGKGYIIKANAAASITVDGGSVSSFGNIALKTGFNLVGISKQVNSIKFSELMASNSSVRGLYRYNSASGSFVQAVRNASGITDLLDGIDPAFTIGQSYFIYMASDNTLNYDGGQISIGGSVTPPVGGQTLSLDLGGGVILEMVKISAGTFQMGSPGGEAGKSIDETLHAVTITKDFYIGKYELTQGQWKALMNGANPSSFKTGDNYPVENISWNDIYQSGGYLEKINSVKPGGYIGFRLPTEAEWEYACRANKTSAYYWGASIDGDYLWYASNSSSKTHPAGSAPGTAKGINVANAFGLYDMSGNVSEWCNEWYAGDYGGSAVTDPAGPATGSQCMFRGGNWYSGANSCRSAVRYGNVPATRNNTLGFRLALTPGQLPSQSKVEAPAISPDGGTFTSAQQVTLTCQTSGATIKYTTDGSTPSATAGTTYSAAFTVSSSTTVKAIATKIAMTDSNVTTTTFTINLPVTPSGQNISVDLGGGMTLEMVRIPAGTFQMGSPATESGRSSFEGPQHAVTIANDFYMGKYEMTQGQWKAIMNNANPSVHKTGDNYPVEGMSWNDICLAGGLLEKINALMPSGYRGFRLPTEAEWEYSCRAGAATPYYWGSLINGDYCWSSENSGLAAHPVGQKKANAFGLYDMSGNVWEWCQDNWHDNYYDAPADGSAPWVPGSGNYALSRVIRGCGSTSDAQYYRSATRMYTDPAIRPPGDTGLRLVLTLVPQSLGKVETPAIYPLERTFTTAQQVSITCQTAGAAIKYTTDGSTPSAAVGMTYSGTFSVSLTTTIKAIAVKSQMTDSNVATAIFTIGTQPPPIGGPAISVDLGGGVMLEMIKISAAGKSFQMGSPASDPDKWLAEVPAHAVNFTKDYYIGKYELTQGQWKAIMNGVNPSNFKSGDKFPVENVSWDEICQNGGYLEKLNAAKPGGYSGFRLPTEAEWEFACRAGAATPYYWGASINGDYCWYGVNSENVTHPGGMAPAGSNSANAFGLYDMSGNVWEFCSGFYETYSSSAVTDPSGPAIMTNGVVARGGSYFDVAGRCRSAAREANPPSLASINTGFRIALTAGQ